MPITRLPAIIGPIGKCLLLFYLQRPEPVDGTFRPRTGTDQVAVSADHAIGGRLEIEAAIEIEAVTVILQLGPHALAAAEHQVELGTISDQCAGEFANRDAFGTLFLDPANRRGRGYRGHTRHANDSSLPDDELRQIPMLARHGKRGGGKRETRGQEKYATHRPASLVP